MNFKQYLNYLITFEKRNLIFAFITMLIIFGYLFFIISVLSENKKSDIEMKIENIEKRLNDIEQNCEFNQ